MSAWLNHVPEKFSWTWLGRLLLSPTTRPGTPQQFFILQDPLSSDLCVHGILWSTNKPPKDWCPDFVAILSRPSWFGLCPKFQRGKSEELLLATVRYINLTPEYRNKKTSDWLTHKEAVLRAHPGVGTSICTYRPALVPIAANSWVNICPQQHTTRLELKLRTSRIK